MQTKHSLTLIYNKKNESLLYKPVLFIYKSNRYIIIII